MSNADTAEVQAYQDMLEITPIKTLLDMLQTATIDNEYGKSAEMIKLIRVEILTRTSR